MAQFEVGQVVKLAASCSYASTSSSMNPKNVEGIITEFKLIGGEDRYEIRWDTGSTNSYYYNKDLEFIKSKKNNMNIVKVFKNLTRTEPEKSAVKAGILDENNTLTSDGKELLLAYLYDGVKVDFNTKVVQPIITALAEESK